MVSSIRYWLKVFGISNQDEPSRIADYLFDESEGVDKYIESLGTLWLLHYLLVSLKEATLYHITFVQFQKERKIFEREQLVNFVKRLMIEDGNDKRSGGSSCGSGSVSGSSVDGIFSAV